jgi:S-adenosylhomocysteine hydrolase
MDGFEVKKMANAIGRANIVITTTSPITIDVQ